MRKRISKLLLPIVSVFLFFISVFIMKGNRIDAASMDFYYPNTVVANAYDSEGAAILKESIDVYAYNNGFGYRINGEPLRISGVTISTGTYEKRFSVDGDLGSYISVSNQVSIPSDGTYGTSVGFDSAYVDKITLKLKAMYDSLGVSGTAVYNNTISIKIDLQLAHYTLWWISSWEDVGSTNSYKGGTKQSSNTVSLDKTNSDFTLNKLAINDVSLTMSTYTVDNKKNADDLRLTITTNMKFRGYIRAYFTESRYISLYFSTTNTQSISLNSSLLSSDMDSTVFTFNKFTVNTAYDRYNSKISTIVSNGKSASVAVDTINPTVTKAGVANTEGSVFYDVSEVITNFTFSENVSFTITSLTFQIGQLYETRTCSENCTAYGTTINLAHDLSGNGIVKVISFAAIITDNLGNTTEYNSSNSSSVCVNNTLTLTSAINSISTNKTYYYKEEYINIKIEVPVNDENPVTPGIDITKIVIRHNESEDVVFDDLFGKEVVEGYFSITYRVITDKNDFIRGIDVYDETNSLVFTNGTYIYFNRYLNLGFNNKTYTNPENKSIKIYEGTSSDTFDGDKITIISKDAAITTNSCVNWVCTYTSSKDGTDSIKVEAGAVILSNGQKNKDETFTIIVNERAPLVSNITVTTSKIEEYSDKYYYNTTGALLTFELSDGYGEEMCLYYKFDSQEYSRVCEDYEISFPQTSGEHTLYYYTSDGTNNAESVTYEKTFTYRSGFETGDMVVLVNEINVASVSGNINSSKKYNSLIISYSGAGKIDLFKSFSAVVHAKTNISLSSNDTSKSFNVNVLEFGRLDDVVDVDLIFVDKLGNSLTYKIKVNIDTIAPEFDSIVAQNSESGGTYTVKLTGYGDNDISIEVDGIEVEFTNDTFTTVKNKYTIILVDSAGNRSERVFTTVSPAIQLNLISTTVRELYYEVYITPFDSSVHAVEGFRTLVFDYNATVSETMLNVARNNVCTIGRKVNCYINGTYTSNVGQIYNTFTKGYTYVLEVKVNGVLAKAMDSDALPRLDLVGPDSTLPVGNYLDTDLNPDFISTNSGENFVFNFLASDVNLSDSYYYMVVNSSIDSTMSVEKFYTLYTSCYGDTADNNKCAYKGENAYKESVSGKANTYLGEVVITANTNTRRRMKNNVEYSLYVLLVDESTNATLFKVRDFKNITQSSNVYYLDDNSNYIALSNGQEVITANTSTVKISTYNNVGIKSIKINDTSKTCNTNSCEYELSIGRYVVEVVDDLGNKIETKVFSATANHPLIYINYQYNGEYFRILDNTLAYNTANAGNVYLKVAGNNLSNIKISMATSKTYTAGDTIYDQMISSSNQYGYSLSSIIQGHNGGVYAGTVIISAENSDGGETIITLLVDNDKPVITLKPAGSKVVNLLGTLYDLDYASSKYSLTYNYQRDINYALLMESLSVKIDGISFEEIKDINRLTFKVDGNVVTDFDSTITLGNKTITIDYFDVAGNVADTITLQLTTVDNDKPIITLLDQIEIAEINVLTKLATVIVEDNYDSSTTIVLNVKVGGVDIDYANHKFTSVGETTITYTATDTNGNVTTLTQTVFVKDTLPPELKPGTVTEYTIGFNTNLEIDIPVFVDNDENASEYTPYQIKMFDIYSNLMNDSLSNYPLVVKDNKITLRFADSLQIGAYTIVFIAKDNQNNAMEATYTIHVTDREPPRIEIKINGIVAENNSVVTCGWGKAVTIEARAFDSYQGDLSSKVVQTLTLNGKKVNAIDTSVNGNYVLTVTVKDNYNNTSTATITIKVAKDETPPTLTKFTINGVEIKEGKTNRLNQTYLLPVIEANDASNLVSGKIIVDDKYTVKSGEKLDLELDLSGKMYIITLVVSDSSDNEIRKTYTVIIDNKAPSISGFDNNTIYHQSVSLSIYDDNINLIRVYRNGALVNTYTENLGETEYKDEGLYRIVAMDSYGNLSDASFAIYKDKKFNVVDGNNQNNSYEYNASFLLEVKVEENVITFILDSHSFISKDDKIYILVKYPNSEYKYIIYSMNGITYLSNGTISTDMELISGYNNLDLLEKIDDKYYAYAMVIKGEPTKDTSEKKNFDFKPILWAIFVIVGMPLLVWLLIKMRRRVRAV